ncbi:PD-(D/E)XK nuclease family transposase [bacterium]|nr:PD-(D/E)XK nuclease family transposase [bacterium]
MYLVSMNYDRFFKKVFDDVEIAKTFLEDFLEIEIKEIEIFKNKNYLTDSSLAVEFDYRCKLNNGEYVIIEMQQWHKIDVAKRFYLYHCLSTSLQLEKLREIPLGFDSEKKKILKERVYSDLKPAITLIWMVDDNLGFENDYIVYKTDFENYSNFIFDENLWSKDIKEIKKERKTLFELRKNREKDIDSIQKNRLIFMFQSNIVKNNKNKEKLKKYVRWFDFAEKSKKNRNIEADFKEYTKDKIFSEIIKRLKKDRLKEDDMMYILSEEKFKEEYLQYTSAMLEKTKEVEEKNKELEEKTKEVEEKTKEVEEKTKEVEEKTKEVEEKTKEVEKAQVEKEKILKTSINKFLKLGLSKKEIAETLNIPLETLNDY